MTDVALLSNYRTRNLGNLALTRSVQRLLATAYGPEHLLTLHRLSHPIADLTTRDDLDRWIGSLRSQMGPLDALPRPDRSTFGEREPSLATANKERSVKSTQRALVLRAAHGRAGIWLRASLDRSAGRRHLGALLSTADLVWNPAGEINTTTTPTTRLLEVEAALDQGTRVAMVNLSFEPTRETLDYFRRRVSRFHHIIGRDEQTASALVDLGMEPDRAVVAPDAVFLIGSDLLPGLAPPIPTSRRDVVGLVPNGLTPIDAERWGLVADRIRRQGSGIEILSSHMAMDELAIRQLIDVVGGADVTVVPEFTDITNYLSHLAGLRAVVTGRFHTAVMGLISGATIVGVDTYGRKIAGGLATAGFGAAVVDGPDWPDQAAAIVQEGRTASLDSLTRTRKLVLAAWARAFPMQ